MRQQQRTILDALLGAKIEGVLDFGAEFLTLDDLMKLAATVNERMKITTVDLNRSTVQYWLKTGILPDKTDRINRNRLFSGRDLIRLVVVSQLTAIGIRPRFASHMADETIIAMGTDWYGFYPEKALELNIDDFIWAVPVGDKLQTWPPQTTHDEATRADSLRNFALHTKLACIVLMVNARMIVAISTMAFAEYHDAKLLEWKDKLTVELDRKKAKKEKP